jgi:hypothetical protein
MAGTPIDFIRYAADQALAVPAQINLRPYTVTVNTLTWDGDRPGVGNLTQTSTPIYNDGYINPRFRQVTREEVVLSAGVLRDQDVVIGPFVFPYDDGLGDTGGLDPLTFSPPISITTEFYINIVGPNFPTGGLQFKKIWDNSERSVMYRVYLRNTAATLP